MSLNVYVHSVHIVPRTDSSGLCQAVMVLCAAMLDMVDTDVSLSVVLKALGL